MIGVNPRDPRYKYDKDVLRSNNTRLKYAYKRAINIVSGCSHQSKKKETKKRMKRAAAIKRRIGGTMLLKIWRGGLKRCYRR
jgi:hypothetical protein